MVISSTLWSTSWWAPVSSSFPWVGNSAALKAHSSPVHSLTLLRHPSPPCSRFLQRGLSHSLCQGPPVLPSKDKPNVRPLPAWPSRALGWEHNSLRAASGEQNKAGRAFDSLGPLRNVPRQRSGSSAGVREAPGEGEYPAGLACRSQCRGTGTVREGLCRGKHAWALRRPPLPAAATSATLRVSGLANLPEYPQEICRTALACGTRAEQSSPHVAGWGKLLLPARGLSAQPARGHQRWLSHSRPWPPALAVPAGSGRALHGLVEREGFRKVLQVLVQTFFKKVPLLKRSYLLHCELSGVAAQVLGCQADFACCFCCKIDVAIVPLPLSSMQELNVMFSWKPKIKLKLVGSRKFQAWQLRLPVMVCLPGWPPVCASNSSPFH